ncbi:hydrolase 2, exosortase A system-associated [Janthinobacterium sp. 17J80-10]|uniref:hydrolase 2, exosortase A system-associated n=1 Tax=Janthinobacterium sp. 17J80-10 TaxID=2497863 RepID=UPI00100538C0|nr:hydrolase 2, exosortase A system-associated [Janthinobacterium sp. 17J80-10]QAU35380.1 hydrolase 2, exosortase A system-associated [Janthinobacterium sp. 17J80-10]
MTQPPVLAPARPFFLDAAPGTRFCLYHAADVHTGCRGAFIYVHPFAEEMNKSRRVAACQARALAAQGYAVLQIDLFGCGDSSGDFADARWEIWKTDLAAAHAWLRREIAAPICLWGVRLGALLALDFAHEFQGDIQSLLLWQPVLRGDAYLTQFLRIQTAAEMLAGQAPGESGTHKLREKLYAGESVEVAGYRIAPAIAKGIEAVDAAALVPRQPTHWFELTQEPQRPLSPATSRLASSWAQHGAKPIITRVQCPPFWLAQESDDCPELITATSARFGIPPA